MEGACRDEPAPAVFSLTVSFRLPEDSISGLWRDHVWVATLIALLVC